MIDLLMACPLSATGRAAVAAPDPSDSDPLLLQFNAAIAPYGTERQKMDWPLVERVGSTLAAQRCDLKLYGYLGLAVFSNVGEDDSPYLPLGALLCALSDLIEQGWARCLPRSDTRRQAQLKWWSEEISLLVKARPPKPAQRSVFDACLAAAERTAELSGSALGLGYPILRELREALKEHERTLPAPVAPAAAPPPSAVPVPTASAPSLPQAPSPSAGVPAVEGAPPAAPTITAPSPAPVAAVPPALALPAAPQIPSIDPAQLSKEALEDQLGALVVQLAGQLRADSQTDPAPYWLVRALRWANHDLLRPDRVAEVLANKGRSQIPLPQGHARLGKDMTKRLAAGQHAAVVGECEELFAMNPLWLDLQRWIATGLDAMGAEQARAAVTAQVGMLLRLCPQIAELRFADRDATPFADSETVRWLQSELASRPTQEAPHQPLAQAEPLPEGLLPGVQFLQKQMTDSASGVRRFEVRLRLIELLLSKERSDIAMPVVDQLLEAIDAHRLIEWQPDLAQRALRLAVQTARAAELNPVRRATLWSRICQVAPADAVQLGPELLPSER